MDTVYFKKCFGAKELVKYASIVSRKKTARIFSNLEVKEINGHEILCVPTICGFKKTITVKTDGYFEYDASFRVSICLDIKKQTSESRSFEVLKKRGFLEGLFHVGNVVEGVLYPLDIFLPCGEVLITQKKPT